MTKAPSPTDLAYLAGMIDGDGYISVVRSIRYGREYFGATIGIGGTRREPHDFAAYFWGGRVSMYTPKNPNHRPQFQWQRAGLRAVHIIEALLPYLRVKIDQAHLALEVSEHIACSKDDDPFPWFSSDYDHLPDLRRMRADMIELNQSRKRSRNPHSFQSTR